MCSRKRRVDFIPMSAEKLMKERNTKYWLYSGNLKNEFCLSIKTKTFSGSLFLFTGIKFKPKSMSLITSPLTSSCSKLKLFTTATRAAPSSQKVLLSPASNQSLLKLQLLPAMPFLQASPCSARLTSQRQLNPPSQGKLTSVPHVSLSLLGSLMSPWQ